jgi:30S ribosomal protein S31
MESAMGRGDSRSRKGKIYKGSYGNVRPHRVAGFKAVATATPAVKVAAKPTLKAKKSA